MSRQPEVIPCPTPRAVAVGRTLSVIGGKWTIQIIRSLLEGTKRFGPLFDDLPGISPKMLAERLRELEDGGYVTRTQYPEIPLRVEYALTSEGRSLRPIIRTYEEWGKTFGETIGLMPDGKRVRTRE